MSNASITPIGTAIQGVAISLVAVTALIGIYEAFFDGGNLRAAAVTMLKYIIVAYIITNWTNLFQTMITDMATVTNTLQGGANVNTDVYDAFNQSLQTYYTSTGDGILTQLFNAASGQILMVVLTAICSFIESAAYMFFCFWYTFWGAILWGIGPIIIALLPSSGLGKYAIAYLSKVGEWLLWPILYAILGAIMVALNMNTATAILNTNSTLSQQSQQVYIIATSIALAICLLTIPFTAHTLVTGHFALAGGVMVGLVMKTTKVAMSAGRVGGGGGAGGGGAGGGAGAGVYAATSGGGGSSGMQPAALYRSDASGSGGGRMPPPHTPPPAA
ncbi:MAG: type IV secretion system protein [Candidatus Korobacteraceae bacterium]